MEKMCQKEVAIDLRGIKYVSLDVLSAHTGLGRITADKVAKQAGAKRKVGRRAVYDWEATDEYINRMGS